MPSGAVTSSKPIERADPTCRERRNGKRHERRDTDNSPDVHCAFFASASNMGLLRLHGLADCGEFGLSMT
jgi:hypothetical protein